MLDIAEQDILCMYVRRIHPKNLVFLGFAGQAITDNVLISTTACVFFTFSTAVFARGRLLNTSEVA